MRGDHIDSRNADIDELVAENDRLLATVDAERARREQAEAERDELAAQLEAVLNEGLTADEFRRKYLDATPAGGNPDE